MRGDLMLNPAIIAGVATVIVALVGFASAKFGRRKEKADAAAIITATAVSLLAPLNSDIAKLSGKVSALETEAHRRDIRIADLERDNRHLRLENTSLRGRITTLETQIVGLGHTPVNGTPATVTQTTTEKTTTVTEQQ
jgi:regulator of replication initiation timing